MAVAGYVKNIAFFIIFMAFADIIVPSGSLRGYVRLILSIILIAVTIEPLGMLFGGAGLERNYIKALNYADSAAINRYREMYDKEAAEAVLAEYEKRLNTSVAQAVADGAGIAPKSVSVVVNGDYESGDFGEILGAHVIIEIQEDEDEPGYAKRIMLGNAANGADLEQARDMFTEKVRNCLTSFYNIPESNIHVTVE